MIFNSAFNKNLLHHFAKKMVDKLPFSNPPFFSEKTGKIFSLCLSPHIQLSEHDSWKNKPRRYILLYDSDETFQH